jgi:ferritin-like metal-binding protein YciE
MNEWGVAVVCGFLGGIYFELRSLRSDLEKIATNIRSGNGLTQEALKHAENTNFHVSEIHSLVDRIESIFNKITSRTLR